MTQISKNSVNMLSYYTKKCYEQKKNPGPNMFSRTSDMIPDKS